MIGSRLLGSWFFSPPADGVEPPNGEPGVLDGSNAFSEHETSSGRAWRPQVKSATGRQGDITRGRNAAWCRLPVLARP